MPLTSDRRTLLNSFWRKVRKAPASFWFGVLIIVLYAVCAVFAGSIAPHGEAELVGNAYEPPGADFWLGTDQIGRDVFSRLVYGARNTIAIALATAVLSFVIGGTLGVFAALMRGWFDHVLSRLVDILMSIPVLIFALMLLAMLGKGLLNMIIILAILDSTRVFRLTRAVSMNIVVMEYVEVAKLRGEGVRWIMLHEIVPNIALPLLAEFGLRFCFVFLTVSALSFLGVGIQPPSADWGSMVAENKTLIIYGNPTPLLAAGAIALMTIAVNFVVDWCARGMSGKHEKH